MVLTRFQVGAEPARRRPTSAARHGFSRRPNTSSTSARLETARPGPYGVATRAFPGNNGGSSPRFAFLTFDGVYGRRQARAGAETPPPGRIPPAFSANAHDSTRFPFAVKSADAA